jgi:hypothetical protein
MTVLQSEAEPMRQRGLPVNGSAMRQSRLELAVGTTEPAGQPREPRSQGSALVLQRKPLARCRVPSYISRVRGATLSVQGVVGSCSCRLAFARGSGVIAANHPFVPFL